MTGLIAQRLEAAGLHGLVYARQYWAETCPAFANPNTLVLCVVNPFNPLRASWSAAWFPAHPISLA